MYLGLGQTSDAPPCNTLMMPVGTYGPFNCTGDQSQVMKYDSSGDEAAPAVSPITLGSVENWLEIGNNAVYAGLAAAAALVALGIMGRR